MVEVLFSRIKFTINDMTCDVWFAGTIEVDGEKHNLIFDHKVDALAWCSKHDLTCGFLEWA